MSIGNNPLQSLSSLTEVHRSWSSSPPSEKASHSTIGHGESAERLLDSIRSAGGEMDMIDVERMLSDPDLCRAYAELKTRGVIREEISPGLPMKRVVVITEPEKNLFQKKSHNRSTGSWV